MIIGAQQKKEVTISKRDIENIPEELIFSFYLKDVVNADKRYLSPFRKDKTPGCRFERRKSRLYFVDNAGYKGKLYFDTIAFVMNLFDISFQEAVYKIYTEVGKSHLDFKVKKVEQKSNREIDIRFKYIKWDSRNYFTEFLDIPIEYLNNQPYHNVANYWCTTKKDRNLVRNRFGHNCVAYYFEDSNHTCLYWPHRLKHNKFFTNMNSEDVFGYHRISSYIERGGDLYIVSGGKDEMCLNYHAEANTLGLHSENGVLPNKIVDILHYFNTIFVIMDNDKAGKIASEILVNKIKMFHDNVIPMFPISNDISETYEEYGEIMFQ